MHGSYQKSHWRKMLRLSDQIDQVDFYYLISCAILRPLFIVILYIINKIHISKSKKKTKFRSTRHWHVQITFHFTSP